MHNEPPGSLLNRSRTLPGLDPFAVIGLYVVLVLLPLGLAAFQGLPSRSISSELSSALVMVGFAMMLVQFLLSGRIRSLSGKIGIDMTMRFHQLAAWIVLALILVHPLLFAVPRLTPNPADALTTLSLMFSSQRLRTGVVGWCLLIMLVPLAAFRERLRMSYEAWRLSHALGAAAIAAFGLHHALRVGTYSTDVWLTVYWTALTALALLSLVRVRLIEPVLQLRAPYHVVSNRRVAHRMWEVAVKPQIGKPLSFAAGQFVWLKFGRSPFNVTEHPFSISSAPTEPVCVRFTIRESGDFTNRISTIAVGTRAYLDGPHGRFTLAGRDARKIVFIAGGVGFAPIFSMLRQLAAERHPHAVRLIYGNRNEMQILYAEEIETLKHALDLEVHLVLSEPPASWSGSVGELSLEVIRVCLGPADPDALYFVCGPPAMMNSVEHSLAELGIQSRQVIFERFRYE